MSAALLSSLREPPVIGRFYMVPVVPFIWCGIEAEWPVIGPLHTDREFFGFDRPHYHVDARFVSADLERRIDRKMGRSRDLFGKAQGYPLARRNVANAPEVPIGRPALRRMKCRTARFPYRFHEQSAVSQMRAAYGDHSPTMRAKPIRLADGRMLCPHRKADLSQIEPDADGVVTCPLHGLRICVRETGQ